MSKPGEYETMKGFEEHIRNNLIRAIQFSNETRKLVDEAQQSIVTLQGVVHTQQAQIEELRKQLALVLTKVYSGGTESGDKR